MGEVDPFGLQKCESRYVEHRFDAPLCPSSLKLLLISVNFKLGPVKVIEANMRVLTKPIQLLVVMIQLCYCWIVKCCHSVDHTTEPCCSSSSSDFVPLLQEQEGALWPDRRCLYHPALGDFKCALILMWHHPELLTCLPIHEEQIQN